MSSRSGKGPFTPTVLGSFEFRGTGTVHIAMTEGHTLCGRPTGELGLRGNEEWVLREAETPVGCARCLRLALRSDAI